VVVIDDGHSAPIYCSGWLDPAGRDLQASGRLEPFALAAFGPYYRGPPEVRVHAATLSSTSQWSARANELTARVRLELGNLGEDDLTVRGRTVLDVQTVAGEGKPSSLSGEITLSGPLDDHTAWQGTFLPGDAGIQHLVARLQSRGVESIRLPLLPEPIFVSLRPASASVMTDIAAAAKEVREALEILATPLPEELPAHAQEPPAEPSPGPGETPAPSGATLAPAAESAPIAPLDAASSSPAPAAGPLRAIAPDVPARAP